MDPRKSRVYGPRVSSESPAARHLPALDGLRGLALLGVLFFHANGLLPGGYLGVDLFFVLSGFLITSLLLSEHARNGRIALSAFWVRRARRLFPALLSLMPAVAIYSLFYAKSEELAQIRGDALATLAYVANWRTILSHKSYWDLFTTPSPLEHTWSLSIEEQFYLLWPLIVVAVLGRKGTAPTSRFRNSRALLILSIALAAASAGTMIALFDPENISRVYLGTDTRATAILLGAILACVLPMSTQLTKSTVLKLDGLGILSAIFLGIAWWSLNGQDPRLYHGLFWLTELATLALITCAVAGRQSIVARALAFKPLTLVGTISYGLYLWHWPVDVFLNADRAHFGGMKLVAIQLVVTFAIAIASYHLLEKPIRRRGVPFGKPWLVVPASLVLAIFTVVRATHARPLPPPAPVAVLPPAEPEKISFQILLLGDSTANSLGWGLRGVQRKGVAVENRGQDGCTMLADTCRGEKWFDDVKDVHPNATLVFPGGAFLHGLTLNGRWTKACARGWDDKFEKNMSKRLNDLALAAQDTHGEVWALTLPDPLGPYDSAPFRKEVDCINDSIRKVASAVRTIHVLEFGAHVCPNHECARELNGKTIRPDGVHYDIDGARELSRWILDQIGAPEPPPETNDGGAPDEDAATALH
jgi:peptidoglycan/LPS O-acetylase OafA/YrhL